MVTIDDRTQRDPVLAVEPLITVVLPLPEVAETASMLKNLRRQYLHNDDRQSYGYY